MLVLLCRAQGTASVGAVKNIGFHLKLSAVTFFWCTHVHKFVTALDRKLWSDDGRAVVSAIGYERSNQVQIPPS